MTERRPAYRALVPGQQHFDCQPLKAILSTQACTERWRSALDGTTCANCAVGRLHADVGGLAVVPIRRRRSTPRVGICCRCGESGRRLIVESGICLSCYNRQREFELGRNAKGKPPEKFKPLRPVEVTIKHEDGRVERRVIQARHQAEALARTLRAMPPGSTLLTGERHRTGWNVATREFEHVCERCNAQGLILERVRGGNLERHAWCCGGEPVGASWQLAQVRQPIFSMTANALAGWLGSDTNHEEGGSDAWVATAYPCATCGAGQLEARLPEPGGRWRCRCTSCGTASE